jgi:hypothetical protein
MLDLKVEPPVSSMAVTQPSDHMSTATVYPTACLGGCEAGISRRSSLLEVRVILKNYLEGTRYSRCSILLSADKGRHSLASIFYPSSGSKISQDGSGTCRGACHEDILGLEVSVDDIVVMEVNQRDENLSNYGGGLGFKQHAILGLDVREQIPGSDEILKDIPVSSVSLRVEWRLAYSVFSVAMTFSILMMLGCRL